MQSIPTDEAEALKPLVGDRYQLQSLLGNNPGRKTLLAIDNETGEKVVLKLLLFGKEFAWQDLKLFEREAETLRSLEHAAIPQYLDYFDVESATVKGFALVQSYIDARSLETQVAAGRRFSEEELEQIAQQLLEILEYLHSRQPAVIHRDIKPSNILLTDRTAHSVGQVYLVDFGSVQTLAAREGGTITVVGTYGYMPPEQFGGRAVPASDLYSLGATLIYLASGRHPADLPQDELRLEFEEFVQLSPKMVSWLQKLLQPGFRNRLHSAAQALKAKYFWTDVQDEIIDASILGTALKPLNSSIEVSLSSEGMCILLPVKQFRLAKFNRLNYWDRAIAFFGAMLLTLLPFIMISNSIESHESDMWWALLFSMPTFVVFILLGVWLDSLFRGNAEIYLVKNQLFIRRPHRSDRVLLKKNIWLLQRLQENSIQLSVGDWRIVFNIRKEEREWLLYLLATELNFPVN